MSLYLECLAGALTPFNVLIAFVGTMAGIIFWRAARIHPVDGYCNLNPFYL